jgi:hypothetical protein
VEAAAATLARESRHIVAFLSTTTTSRAADSYLSIGGVKRNRRWFLATLTASTDSV